MCGYCIPQSTHNVCQVESYGIGLAFASNTPGHCGGHWMSHGGPSCIHRRHKATQRETRRDDEISTSVLNRVPNIG